MFLFSIYTRCLHCTRASLQPPHVQFVHIYPLCSWHFLLVHTVTQKLYFGIYTSLTILSYTSVGTMRLSQWVITKIFFEVDDLLSGWMFAEMQFTMSVVKQRVELAGIMSGQCKDKLSLIWFMGFHTLLKPCSKLFGTWDLQYINIILKGAFTWYYLLFYIRLLI